ncbi:hypothetical protein ACVBEE_02715 [Acinetobacter sp. ANC 3781]
MFTRKAKSSSDRLQEVTTGLVVVSIFGSVKALKIPYKDALVILYNKQNLKPIAVKRPNIDGSYSFLGLNTNLKTFLVAFDKKQKYNAVIQDNVRPK